MILVDNARVMIYNNNINIRTAMKGLYIFAVQRSMALAESCARLT